MCEYCGCHQNPFIAQLMDEHDQLSSLGDSAVRALEQGDTAAAAKDLREFDALLRKHNDLEERGIFAAMRELGEFVELIDELEGEHTDLHTRLDEFDAAPPIDELKVLLTDLAEHVEKENRGVFPFAYSAFSTPEWSTVEHAHR
ncbi:MAG: hemerythrin domain-containing protein [Propionibacteriaceae bacterium]|nr:hemerythrin domain-containing protein [Propionibacteriaceae bacterium]